MVFIINMFNFVLLFNNKTIFKMKSNNNMQNVNPKEKAEEIFEKFYSVSDISGIFNLTRWQAIECCLIHVDEIINLDGLSVEGREYWMQVKHEIEES